MGDHSRYFDYNATTPMHESAVQIWVETSQSLWHNPSSLYADAGYAKQRLEDAREDLADLLGIEDTERIVFTSGATEANNAILRHLAANVPGRIAISGIEHPSVMASAEVFFGSERIVVIPVDPMTGVIDFDALKRELETGSLGAVSIMAANNETGTLQPWDEIAKWCQEFGVPYHCDAAQWVGKLSLEGLGACDWLTASAHKFGGGKGGGFLLLPENREEDFQIAVGGPQEGGRRAGTENLAAVLAMVKALEMETESPEASQNARDQFESVIEEKVGALVIGQAGPRLWNTSMILLPHTKNLKWLTRLSRLGFAVSTGSACSAGKGNPSQVMAAMGVAFDEMGRVLRISSGRETAVDDWLALADSLAVVEAELR